jgi:hypothetical protein
MPSMEGFCPEVCCTDRDQDGPDSGSDQDSETDRELVLAGIPQMGPIRAQFWLSSASLASWTRRNWRKTDRASGIGPIPRSKMAIFLSYGRTSP